MFNAIVVGTDGSESAGVAVHKAATLAGFTGGTCTSCARTVPSRSGNVAMAASTAASTLDVDSVNRSVITEAELIADHAASEARRGGVKVEVHTIPGEAADVLVGVAKEIGAELLVVGNRGMSGKRRFVLGSVPNKVSHHAPCALLIVDTVDQ